MVLMDIKMPVLDGYSAAKRLKADEDLRQISVIALTGSVLRESEEELTQVCEGFLRKRLARRELVNAMSQLLSNSVEGGPKLPDVDESSASQDWSAVQLSDVTRERLPDLIAALEAERGTWEEVSTTLTIDGVDEFAGRLKGLGTDYDFPPLVNWGESLASRVNEFDMDGIRDTLAEFPDLIATIDSVSA